MPAPVRSMELPRNTLKAALRGDEVQIGMWLSLVDPIPAEIAAGAGFDWLLIDAEHAPNDVRTVLAQLYAVAGYRVAPVVRPVRGDAATIKQFLDIGVQTLLIPMVESAEQAVELVRAVRYPPRGVRGVATTRAARWGRVNDYWATVEDEVGLVVQIESVAGIANCDAILAVEGIDGIFIGPSDLAASLGRIGQPDHPDVQDTVIDALQAARRAGLAAGVLATDPAMAERCISAGANLVAVGVDTMLLARATTDLVAGYRSRGQVTDESAVR